MEDLSSPTITNMVLLCGPNHWIQMLKKRKKKMKEELLEANLGEGSTRKYKDIVRLMSQKSESLVETDAWYLSIVGVLPRFQIQGLGVELINQVLKVTDRY